MSSILLETFPGIVPRPAISVDWIKSPVRNSDPLIESNAAVWNKNRSHSRIRRWMHSPLIRHKTGRAKPNCVQEIAFGQVLIRRLVCAESKRGSENRASNEECPISPPKKFCLRRRKMNFKRDEKIDILWGRKIFFNNFWVGFIPCRGTHLWGSTHSWSFSYLSFLKR